MTQEKIEQLAERICSEFVTDKDTTATFGVDFDRKDIVNALIAMADEVMEELKKCKLVDCELKIMDDEKQN